MLKWALHRFVFVAVVSDARHSRRLGGEAVWKPSVIAQRHADLILDPVLPIASSDLV